MNWAWASSLDNLWRSPSLPMWITFAAAVFFALILFVTIFRAEKSVANGALAVITLLAIGIAVAATAAHSTLGASQAGMADRSAVSPALSVPALACLDGLAGDAVEAACEKPLFASAESSAAAVSYTAAQISRLSALAAQASTDNKPAPDVSILRHTLERDRYGLAAHVLSVRDGCTATDCAFFSALNDHTQISSNMNERVYEGLIGRYALSWNNPPAASSAALATPTMPQGKPLSGDFPSSSSIPPVSIMTGEPGGAGAPPASAKPPAPPPHPPTAATAAPKRVARRPPPPAPPAAPAPPPPQPQQSDDN
jgi:hypothetical protein